MTVEELMGELELMPPDAEVCVDTTSSVIAITRVEDDSQGVYIIADQMANDQESW